MKRLLLLFACPVAVLMISGGSIMAQSTDHDALAAHIIETTARVQPGEVVVITGGQHMIPVMEAFAIAVRKAGGRPMMDLNTDRFERAVMTEVDDQHLAQRSPVDNEWIDEMDLFIWLPQLEHPDEVYADVPEARRAQLGTAYAGINDALEASGVRDLFIYYPTPHGAKEYGLDYEEYRTLILNAMKADYSEIARTADTLAQRLQSTRQVRITTPAGTDVTFAIDGDRPVIKNDGIPEPGGYMTSTEYLPAGSVYLAPVETSAQGRVVIPRDRCRHEPMRDVSFTFEDGRMQAFEAAQGAECFEQIRAAHEGTFDRLGTFALGLNPNLSVIEDDDILFTPGNAAGMVFISVGGNTGLLGGENRGGADYYFPLTNATVELDGEVVVKDGKPVR